jgi:hypothetical protein
MRLPDRTLHLQQQRHLSLSTLQQTTSPPAMTMTSYLLLRQCSEFVALTMTRKEVPLCQDRERLSHCLLLKLPLLR